MTSARTDAAGASGGGGTGGGAPAGGTGGFNSGDFNGLGGGGVDLNALFKLIKLPFELISMAVDYNNKNRAADATKRGTELQAIRHEMALALEFTLASACICVIWRRREWYTEHFPHATRGYSPLWERIKLAG